jgi:hypothetical protein
MEIDTREVQALLQSLQREKIPVAVSRALNKTAGSAKSVAVREMARNIGIAQKEIRPEVQFRKATRFCCDAVLLVAKAKRLPLIKSDPRAKQGKVGVSYRGGGGLKRSIAHAFIATMPSGHRGVYVRKPGAGRLPIRELCGPSLAYVFQQPAIQSLIAEVVQARWKICCEQEVHFLLHKDRFR